MVREYGVSPYNILAMTFTNKAAKEMRERLDRLVGSRSDALTVGTFHSFCAKLLRIDGHCLGLEPNYTIYDADDQNTIIKQSMELAEVDPKRNPPRAVLARFESQKLDVGFTDDAQERRRQLFRRDLRASLPPLRGNPHPEQLS
ncbi:MAG: hypothetical protein CM1200mP27_10470 [Chloroflexota bacterium]|nr:MAG: hypothetical protein CM1200mP27_10470 [Chloroflexota bacterium]